MASGNMTTPRPNTAHSAKSAVVSDEALALQIQQFLDDWHYRLMHTSLGKTWSQTKVVTSALEVLALNGFPLDEEEIKDFATVDEGILVSELVAKCPPNLREDFDHLALQLQMLVTTTMRVRMAVDDGSSEAIASTIEEHDGSSIGQQILKMAVVQASKEVAALHRAQDTWVRSMDKRLDRLTRSAEYAEHAQQQLLAVESQLERFGAEQNLKSRNALMGLAEGNDKSLLHTTFSSWLGQVVAGAGERAIREKYEQEIADAEKALFDYREKQLKGVKNVLMEQARQGDAGLVNFCFETWSSQIAENKREGVTKESLMALEAKLDQFSSKQSDSTKKVMARMGADQDGTLVGLAWSAWSKFHVDYKRDKDFEEQVKKTEKQLNAHMDKKKEDAKLVIARLNGATDTGLLTQVMTGWQQCIHETKKAQELDELMQKSGGKFKSMQASHKENAMNVQGRVNEQIKLNLLLKCLCAWVQESKVNHLDKHYSGKMNHKRQQLASVQALFKSFAKQLEEGLAHVDGDSSGRGTTRRTVRGMNKDPGSVSLPDIRAKQRVA
mmetsp:Transcript_16287/g.47640  ORF Transcript_16287/g.47640 Transcript_16287/m.47640 type:complete len:554 (-) Transcript_16287:114-1775(-)